MFKLSKIPPAAQARPTTKIREHFRTSQLFKKTRILKWKLLADLTIADVKLKRQIITLETEKKSGIIA